MYSYLFQKVAVQFYRKDDKVMEKSVKKTNKRWKVFLTMTMVIMMMMPMTAWAKSSTDIQNAIQGASSANFDSIEGFFGDLIKIATNLIPPVATLALLIGVLVAFLCAPLKKYRGVGLGCIVFGVLLLLLYLFLPTIINMLSGNA